MPSLDVNYSIARPCAHDGNCRNFQTASYRRLGRGCREVDVRGLRESLLARGGERAREGLMRRREAVGGQDAEQGQRR